MRRTPLIRWRILVVVIAGGVVGVALREVLLLPFPPVSAAPLALPLATAGVNVVGSFLIGLVAGRLGDRRPHARAFLGAGVLGGFTTYSAFAVQTAVLIGSAPIVGIAFAAASVLLGFLAAALGLRLATRPDES